MKSAEPRLVRAAIAFASACVAAAALYSMLRIVQAIVYREADPALVVMSLHAGYFWRAWTVSYAGGMIGFAVWIAAGRDPSRTACLLAKAIAPVGLLVFLQAMFVP